jgi:hypothetical protein
MKRSKLSKNILIMKKAMASHMTVIILAVLLMFVAFALFSSWIYTAAGSVDPEKLIEIGPESGTATEQTPDTSLPSGNGDASSGSSQAQRIFTTAPNANDFSEIACLIGDKIYSDFSALGITGTRTSTIATFKYVVPFESAATVYFLDGKSFTYATPTSSSDTDEATLSSAHPGCHLCRINNVGITHLDENCINLQLRDRTVGSDNFCSVTIAPSNAEQRVKFGDSNCPSASPGGASWPDNNCDNGIDRIYWFMSSGGDVSWPVWKASYTDKKYNSKTLTNGRDYVYGVFWVSDGDRYDVVFSMIPSPGCYTASNFQDLYSVMSDKGFIKFDALGGKFWQARSVADFNVAVPSGTTVPIGTIADTLGSTSVLLCGAASAGNPCFSDSMIKTDSDLINDDDISFEEDEVKDKLAEEPITVYLGVANVGLSGALPGGKTYRVTVNKWLAVQRYDCWAGRCKTNVIGYDRSVTIQEVSNQITWTLTVSGSNAGQLCVVQSGQADQCASIGNNKDVTLTNGQTVTIKLIPDNQAKFACFYSPGGDSCSQTAGTYTIDNVGVSSTGTMTAKFFDTTQTTTTPTGQKVTWTFEALPNYNGQICVNDECTDTSMQKQLDVGVPIKLEAKQSGAYYYNNFQFYLAGSQVSVFSVPPSNFYYPKSWTVNIVPPSVDGYTVYATFTSISYDKDQVEAEYEMCTEMKRDCSRHPGVVTITKFDANQDSHYITGTEDWAGSACDGNGGDNLARYCACYLSKFTDTECRQQCGCTS